MHGSEISKGGGGGSGVSRSTCSHLGCAGEDRTNRRFGRQRRARWSAAALRLFWCKDRKNWKSRKAAAGDRGVSRSILSFVMRSSEELEESLLLEEVPGGGGRPRGQPQHLHFSSENSGKQTRDKQRKNRSPSWMLMLSFCPDSVYGGSDMCTCMPRSDTCTCMPHSLLMLSECAVV